MTVTGANLMTFSTDAAGIRAFSRDALATLAGLRAKGVALARGPAAEGFGRVAYLDVPGIGELGLYQPSHPTAV